MHNSLKHISRKLTQAILHTHFSPTIVVSSYFVKKVYEALLNGFALNYSIEQLVEHITKVGIYSYIGFSSYVKIHTRDLEEVKKTLIELIRLGVKNQEVAKDQK
jgi:hypothetical protein